MMMMLIVLVKFAKCSGGEFAIRMQASNATGEELPNAPHATHRAGRRKRKRQAKPVARRCDTSSNEPTGTDKDDASATPRGDSPNTGSEAGSTSAAQAVVEPERDVVGT